MNNTTRWCFETTQRYYEIAHEKDLFGGWHSGKRVKTILMSKK